MNRSNRNDFSRGWPEVSHFRKSIRLEFSLYVTGIMLVLMLITGYVITNRYVESITTAVVEKLLVQARSYSGPAGKHILAGNSPDVLMLSNVCKNLAADNKDVFWAGIAGLDSVFLAHTDIKQIVSRNRLVFASVEVDLSALRSGETLYLKDDTILIAIPIREVNVPLGTFAVASSAHQIADARRTSIVTVASITVLMILLGLPVTMLILHRKLRPISVITNHLRGIHFDDISLDIPIASRNEFGYLAETLKVMGSKLNTAQKEIIEHERIAREFEIAHDIQANILPKAYPKTSRFEFAGAYSSAREVGGDYYDFIDFHDDHYAFLVADVSGKSLPGMLLMLLTRDIVKEITRTVQDPAQVLSAANRELLPNIKKGMFVTLFFGLLDKVSGRFRFASAGHNPLIHMIANTGYVQLIKTKGYPLGMMPPKPFENRIESQEIQLGGGDWLVQYTDGINEAQNSDQQEYGMERFVDSLKAQTGLPPAELTAEVLRHHRSFVGAAPQYDDITLLVMRWTTIQSDQEAMYNLKESVSAV